MADLNFPADLKYTENDEWIKVDGDTARIGLTDYAQDQLSDIVYVDLSDVDEGATVAQGETFGAVESVKAASDVYAPASGEVLAVNEALEDEPELINNSPYDNGWMIEIKLSNPGELNNLMDVEAYKAHCDARS